MKKITMKYLCLFIILALPTISVGQYIGDTVVVYIHNRLELKVSVFDYEELRNSEVVQRTLTSFSELIPQIEDRLDPNLPELVRYSSESLEVEPGDPTYTYLINDGSLSNTGYRDRAILSGEGFTIFITTSDLTKIGDLPLASCMNKVAAILPRKSNWSKTLKYECIGDNVSELGVEANNLDQLELSGGAGANLIKGSWAADLSVGLGLNFGKKGLFSHNPYVSANFIFDFSETSNINVNTFLNLGYRWNVGKTNEKKSMLGVEMGYLISKQGDVFGENTMKFGLNWVPVDGVYVSPLLYVTDNFKTAYPGIRIGIGF